MARPRLVSIESYEGRTILGKGFGAIFNVTKPGVSIEVCFSFSFFFFFSIQESVCGCAHGCGYANDSVRSSEQVEQGSSKIRR